MSKPIAASDLARALAGTTGHDEFERSIRERKVRRFPAAYDAAKLKTLFTLARVEAALASGAIPLAQLDAYQGGQLNKLAELAATGERTSQVVRRLFDGGATIRVRDIHRFDPVLGAFTAAVQDLFAARAQINLYLTPPAQIGFPPHWDIMDVFVVQVAGCKDWKIFREYQDAVDLPLRGTPWEPQRYLPIGAPEEFTMQAGDTLYVPRGAMHQALCTGHGSAHLAIGIESLTYADFICQEVRRLAGEDVELRCRLPWSTSDSPEAMAALEAAVRQRFGEIAARFDLGAHLAAERDAIAPVAGEAPAARLFATIDSQPPLDTA